MHHMWNNLGQWGVWIREKCWGYRCWKCWKVLQILNNTNIHTRNPTEFSLIYWVFLRLLMFSNKHMKLANLEDTALHFSASHIISGKAGLSLGFFQKKSMQLWGNSSQKRRKGEKKKTKWSYEREMGCEGRGDHLPNERPQESAGSSAACGRAQLAPPVAQSGTTDDWIPTKNKK